MHPPPPRCREGRGWEDPIHSNVTAAAEDQASEYFQIRREYFQHQQEYQRWERRGVSCPVLSGKNHLKIVQANLDF